MKAVVFDTDRTENNKGVVVAKDIDIVGTARFCGARTTRTRVEFRGSRATRSKKNAEDSDSASERVVMASSFSLGIRRKLVSGRSEVLGTRLVPRTVIALS